jgi:hypothetical protein
MNYSKFDYIKMFSSTKYIKLYSYKDDGSVWFKNQNIDEDSLEHSYKNIIDDVIYIFDILSINEKIILPKFLDNEKIIIIFFDSNIKIYSYLEYVTSLEYGSDEFKFEISIYKNKLEILWNINSECINQRITIKNISINNIINFDYKGKNFFDASTDFPKSKLTIKDNILILNECNYDEFGNEIKYSKHYYNVYPLNDKKFENLINISFNFSF